MTDFKDHFSKGSAAYAAYRPSYPAALVEFLAGLTSRRDLAWESGCGTGQLSVLLGEVFERVIATDASEGPLAEATPHPRVEYSRALAEASGLPDGTVDLAVSSQAAHWFALAGYYLEVRRVARPGSIVALVTYGNVSVDDAVDAIIGRFYSEVLGTYWAPERRHVEDGYRSLPFPFNEVEAPPLVMQAQWNLGQLLGYVDTWSAVRTLEKAVGRAPIEAFRRELAGAWVPEATTRPVHWPLSIRVGRL